MKHLIIAGDSHVGVYHPFSDEILALYTRGALTMDSFSRGQSAAYLDLVEFLKSINRQGCTLVLCVSEVDLRAHFWRDMPMLESRGLSFDEFVQGKVDAFIQRVNQLADTVRLDNVILWGAPASQLTKDNHCEELPATGDNPTRNALTHLLNQCFIRTLARGGTVLRFATPFYGMVSDDLVTDTSWLRDGVHLKFALKGHCLELLQPLLDRSAVATFSRRYEGFKDAVIEFQCLPRESHAVGASAAFRTWIQGEGSASIRLKNRFGEFSLIDSPHEGGPRQAYHELVLRRVT